MPVEIERDRLTIAERINTVLEQLREAAGEVAFEELFRESRTVGEVVITFLALLELMRLRMVRARQAAPGERILVEDIRPDEEEDDGEEPFLEGEDTVSEEEGVPRLNEGD